jgi:branched-chain amino acid transport system permease protein
VSIDLPQGSRLIFLGAIMALVLILRPSGLTGGREFGLPRWRRPVRWSRGDSAQPA